MLSPEEQDEIGRIMVRDAAIRDAQKPLEDRILILTEAIRQITYVLEIMLTRLEALENASRQSRDVVGDHREENRDRADDDPQRRD